MNRGFHFPLLLKRRGHGATGPKHATEELLGKKILLIDTQKRAGLLSASRLTDFISVCKENSVVGLRNLLPT